MKKGVTLLRTYPLRVLLFVFLLFLFLPSSATAEDYEVYIAQGISKINEGKFGEAFELMKKALSLSPQNPEATYYAGIAASRLGRYKEAEELLVRALQFDATAVDAYFELGRLYYLTARCDKAEEFLAQFINLSVNEMMKRYASDLIKSCREEVEEKPYSIDITTGFQYDSNVMVEPSNPVVKEERKSDFRAVLFLDAGVTLFKSKVVALAVDYSFYQSIHMHLNDFNINHHQITPRVQIRLLENVIPTVGYSLEYETVGGDLYSRFHTYFGKVMVKEGERFWTEALYQYFDLKYWDSDVFSANSQRSGHQNTAGIKQNFFVTGVNGNLYFFGDFNRAEESYWSYDGYRGGLELGFTLSPFYITLSGEYGESRYKDDFPGYSEKRFDKTQLYSLSILYMITKKVGVHLSTSYTINDSNLRDFDYKRSITGLFLSAEVL